MSLRSEISAWDGKSARDITSIYNTHAHQPRFVSTLIKLTHEPPLQTATTWLIKHHLEQHTGSIHERHATALYKLAPKLKDWGARLHLLQLMQHLPVPNTQARSIERFVSKCFTEDNKFVRAWAYSGYYELAKHHPKYQSEATAMLNDAIETETAASVLARVRKLIKMGFPTT